MCEKRGKDSQDRMLEGMPDRMSKAMPDRMLDGMTDRMHRWEASARDSSGQRALSSPLRKGAEMVRREKERLKIIIGSGEPNDITEAFQSGIGDPE